MKNMLTLCGCMCLLAAESALAVGLITPGLFFAAVGSTALYRQHTMR